MKTDGHFQVPLRIGLLIDTWIVPYWVALTTAEITASDSAEIVAVVVNQSKSTCYRLLPNGSLRPGKFLLSQFYLYLDHHIFRTPFDVLERINFKDTLYTSTIIDAIPLFDCPHFCFNESDSTQLQALS